MENLANVTSAFDAVYQMNIGNRSFDTKLKVVHNLSNVHFIKKDRDGSNQYFAMYSRYPEATEAVFDEEEFLTFAMNHERILVTALEEKKCWLFGFNNDLENIIRRNINEYGGGIKMYDKKFKTKSATFEYGDVDESVHILNEWNDSTHVNKDDLIVFVKHLLEQEGGRK